MIEPGSRVADIGTDHGLLPIWLVRNDIARTVVASDIAIKPLERARENARRYGCADRISFVCAPGLDGIEPGSVNCVVIAGLGGDVMVSVLDAAQWLRDGCRLVLQPMSRPETVREYLFANGWYLADEKALTDAGRAYVVMRAERGENTLTRPIDIYSGLISEGSGEAGAYLLERSARILRARALAGDGAQELISMAQELERLAVKNREDKA